MPYFLRDKKAAQAQENDWKTLVRVAKRLAEYVPKPCAYCGDMMTLGTSATQSVHTNETQDHITPKSKGGVITVPCCLACNLDKHHLTLNEWRCVLMFRLRRPVLFFFERIALKNWLVFHSYHLSRLLSC